MITTTKQWYNQLQIFFWDLIVRLLTESRLLRRLIRELYGVTHEENKGMKRPLLILFAVLATCFVCGLTLVPGYLNITNRQAALAQPLSSTTNPPVDKNLVIIHVNDIHTLKPVLSSVWVLFINKATTPYLVFKQIYPVDPSIQDANSLSQLMTFTPDNRPSSDFLNALNTYEFYWQNYLVVDDQSASILITWLSGNYHTNQPISSIGNSSKTLGEKQFFTQVCQYLEKTRQQPKPAPVWEKLNITSDANITDLLTHWNALVFNDQPLHCQVIAEP